MGKDVKNWSSKRQSALVLEIIRGETTVDAASKTYGVPSSRLERWIEIGMASLENALDRSLHAQDGEIDQATDEQFFKEQTIASGSESREEIYTRLCSVHAKLNAVFPELPPYEELIILKDWLEEGNSTNTLLAVLMEGVNIHFFENETDLSMNYFYPIAQSYAYCLESEMLEKQGRSFKAAEALRRSTQYCKRAEKDASRGYSATLREYNARLRKNSAEKAARSKAETIYGPIKKEVIRLLYDKRSAEGWKSGAAAARAIADDVDKYQKKITATFNKGLAENDPDRKSEPLLFENIENTLTKWIRKDEKIRATFQETKRP